MSAATVPAHTSTTRRLSTLARWLARWIGPTGAEGSAGAAQNSFLRPEEDQTTGAGKSA